MAYQLIKRGDKMIEDLLNKKVKVVCDYVSGASHFVKGNEYIVSIFDNGNYKHIEDDGRIFTLISYMYGKNSIDENEFCYTDRPLGSTRDKKRIYNVCPCCNRETEEYTEVDWQSVRFRKICEVK